MTVSPSSSTVVAGLPQASTALTRLLLAIDEIKTAKSIAAAVGADQDVTALFLRLSRRALPGRRFTSAREAVPLLGESIAMRLALLAAGATWMLQILGDEPAAGPLLRHAVAAAFAAEPLGRESGIVDALHAFALGLLHHVGEAAWLSARHCREAKADDFDCAALGGELLRSAGATDALAAAVVEYGAFMKDRCRPLALETRILAAADHAVSALGYAAPSPCAQPAVNAQIMDAVASLFDAKRRLCRSIEDALAVIAEPEERVSAAPAREAAHAVPLSPVVLPDVLDGVSTRDLGPLPVLFSRIAGAQDAESIEVAGTAGLVEEMGVSRAYFLRREDKGNLRGGVLSARGNVPLPLHEVVLHPNQLPRSMHLALVTGRPILHEQLGDGLEALWSEPRPPTFFVPVTAGRESLGVLGVEVEDSSMILPDLLAAVAVHMGLALKAVELRRQSDEARIDELTGLFNRRGILDALDRRLERLGPEMPDLAIAMIDCDHLKMVNDNFGHLMGDEFVRRISEVVRQSLRSSDELGRYGGDEFLAVMPDMTFEQTCAAVERARANVEQKGLESQDGLLLSVSIGAVVRGQSEASRERLLKLADFALYRAKARGRNAVEVIDAAQPPDLAM
ncbi:MAG: sensor domain-containing diguanylate cyclase [Planctomycetes bacterium]|nr:sensor domain-containing diguanylate cyclase [Planctomycetota bacterium]